MSNCMRNVDTSPNLFNLTLMEFDTFGFRFGFGLAQILYISHITVLLYNLLIILFVFFLLFEVFNGPNDDTSEVYSSTECTLSVWNVVVCQLNSRHVLMMDR